MQILSKLSYFFVYFRYKPIKSINMFTVNIKGQRDSNEIEWIRLELIFYRTGYNRVPKKLCIKGLYKDWDRKAQKFKECNKEYIDKNKLLQKEKLKYLKIGERWEMENKDWSPIELSHYYDIKARKNNNYLTVSQMIDRMHEKFIHQERYINGKMLISLGTAEQYIYLKRSMEKFTQAKYHRVFSKYMFRDITEQFLRDYILHEQARGNKNKNNGGVVQKLKKLHAVCIEAKKIGVYNVNLSAFYPVKHKYKIKKNLPKCVSHKIIQQIELFDNQLLTTKESFYLDLFLFSYYAAGMSPIDICFLTKDNIKNGMIIYNRIKSDQQARVVIIDKAKALLEKYSDTSYMNYAFPIFKRKNQTQAQLYKRCSRISSKVSQVLDKICERLDVKQKIVWSSARSSYISKMIDEGYHPLQIAEQVGSSPQTIYRYYYTINDKEEMKKNLDSIF